jgi:hypothetical protein
MKIFCSYVSHYAFANILKAVTVKTHYIDQTLFVENFFILCKLYNLKCFASLNIYFRDLEKVIQNESCGSNGFTCL